MFDNLPELIEKYPLGVTIKIDSDRDDYVYGKFKVNGYLYTNEKWYPAHELGNGEWEIYKG